MKSPVGSLLPCAVVAWAAALAAACGPTPVGAEGGGADGGGNMPPGPTTGLSGTVWAPGNAPGMVPDGYEIPVAGATVYIADHPPAPIPDGAYCDRCQGRPLGSVLTDAHGRFVLTGVPAGARRLVIEKAQFRLERTISVPEELAQALGAADTTLPSRHDPAAGMWIPRVAIAIGDSDQVEDIFGKMKIIDVDATGRAVEASFAQTDHLDLYGNPLDPPFPATHKGSITDLFGDLDLMKQYHIIFVPCNYESDVTPLAPATMRQNIQAYVAAGGKLYVTDWSAEWADAAFPEFIGFDASMDTTPAMLATGSVNNGDGDFGHFAEHAKVVDPGMNAWLDGQKAPLVIPIGGEDQDFPSMYQEGVIDADDFVIEGNWTLIRDLPAVQIGTDMAGMPVTTTARQWIAGDYQGQFYPHTVTFEPSCGRVLFSTYHTATKTHQWLVPQERILLYLIMAIGECNDGPIIE